MSFLNYSAEATTPAGYLLMELIKPIIKTFKERFESKKYCDELDSLFIVFVCMEKLPGGEDFYKERKYVSRKNRYADMRLFIDYDAFLQADSQARFRMMWDVMERAIDITNERVKTLKKDELIEDLKSCCHKAYDWF